MIADIGQIAQLVALLFAGAQMLLPAWGARKQNDGLMALARPLATLQAIALIIAFACLAASFVNSDFSVAIVAFNSHEAQPLIYRFAGTWGNHEGSMLLWALTLGLFGAKVAWLSRDMEPRMMARVISVQGAMGFVFLLFIQLTSNPFARLFPAPEHGAELNPLLQDPGLAFHPPMLYFGYVGFSIAFAFSIAALLEGKVDRAWARAVRPWILIAWLCLTIGITAGSYWAYYELGWGGWWYWDPVENASFMPWLLGTALLHCILVVEKRGAFVHWSLLLGILTFSMSLIGTFLVRSGVLTSVHAFAVDPQRGVFILAMIVAATGGGLLLYALRAGKIEEGAHFTLASRESLLAINNLLLVVCCFVVFLGTFYPILVELMGNDRISVGPPYYAYTFVPLFMLLLPAVGLGPAMRWKRDGLIDAFKRQKWVLAAALLTLIAGLVLATPNALMTATGFSLAAWAALGGTAMIVSQVMAQRREGRSIFGSLVRLPMRSWSMATAHLGLAISVVGITGASLHRAETVDLMTQGTTLTLAGHQVTLLSVDLGRRNNFLFEQARFSVRSASGAQTIMSSERRFYPVSRTPTTEAGLWTRARGIFYIALGDADDEKGWVVRLYWHPLAMWIWVGGVLMALGGVIAVFDSALVRAFFSLFRRPGAVLPASAQGGMA